MRRVISLVFIIAGPCKAAINPRPSHWYQGTNEMNDNFLQEVVQYIYCLGKTPTALSVRPQQRKGSQPGGARTVTPDQRNE